MPFASFRNTNGGRMNMVGVGIDSGTSGPGSNARGVLDLRGGVVDMLVDTMWLGPRPQLDFGDEYRGCGFGCVVFQRWNSRREHIDCGISGLYQQFERPGQMTSVAPPTPPPHSM